MKSLTVFVSFLKHYAFHLESPLNIIIIITNTYMHLISYTFIYMYAFKK